MGSLANDVVWEKSDIDLLIVRDDQKAREGSDNAALTSRGINIHASVITRSSFRAGLQKAFGGTFPHSANQLGRILFTRDESLRQIFEEARTLGLNRLVDAGHSVLVIEDHMDVIKQADHVIDLGPDGGHAGGEIVAIGTPEQIAATKASHTGRYLKPLL